MRRILIFNDTTNIGGSEILLIDILKRLQYKDCEVTLLIPFPTEDSAFVASIPSAIKIKYLYKKKPSSLMRQVAINAMVFVPRLYAKWVGIDASGYDIAVCFKDSFYSIAFSRLSTYKVMWVHTQPYERDFKFKNFREFLSTQLNRLQLNRLYKSFRRYDRIFCVSETCKREFIRIAEKGYARENIELFYNALDLSGIEQKANEPSDITIKSDIITFIVVHRFSPEKRIDRMIIIANRLLAEGYRFRIFILGKGEEFESIQKLVFENNLQDTIHLMGHLSNPYPYIKASDWLVCCSSRESFSLVLLEAITLRTPIITTDCGGPVDVIDFGKYGILTQNTTDDLYKAMKKVLDDASQLDYYLSKIDECLERFDYDKWTKKIDQIFGV